MAHIITFPGQTTLDISIEDVCDAAKEACVSLLVLGTDHQGNAYYASTSPDKRQLLWQLEEFKMHLLSGDFDT